LQLNAPRGSAIKRGVKGEGQGKRWYREKNMLFGSSHLKDSIDLKHL